MRADLRMLFGQTPGKRRKEDVRSRYEGERKEKGCLDPPHPSYTPPAQVLAAVPGFNVLDKENWSY